MLNHVFISYRNESPEHARSVHRLGKLLRQAEIPVILDQFFLEENPGGPNFGWPKWCEDNATQSGCVLIVASEGWFAAYNKVSQPDVGFGAAAEADVFRQALWDEKGNNARIRLVFLHNVPADNIPVRLRAWHRFWPFESNEQLDQLVRWLAESLALHGIRQPSVGWPSPVAFKPDIANRNKTEWPAVASLLIGSSRERILLFEGVSGLGKSELLRQAVAYAKQLELPVARVDFKGGILRTEDVLGILDLELGVHLPNFSRDGAGKTSLLRKDLRALRQPVLLILDSYEFAADNKPLADWLNQQLLTEIETALGLAMIVAGQKVPDFANAGWRDLAKHIKLEPITDIEPWKEWVARHHPAFLDSGYDLLTLVKASSGNPLVMSSLCAATVRS